jgi:hypothetical protein
MAGGAPGGGQLHGRRLLQAQIVQQAGLGSALCDHHHCRRLDSNICGHPACGRGHQDREHTPGGGVKAASCSIFFLKSIEDYRRCVDDATTMLFHGVLQAVMRRLSHPYSTHTLPIRP